LAKGLFTPTDPERPLRVLITDSSRLARRIVSRALTDEIPAAQLEITSVGSGREALQALDSSAFDLITCSLMLPDMYGLELCRRVRSDDTHRFTPFIVITAEPYERIMKAGYSAGVTDYYDKTRGFEDFMRFIRGFATKHAALVGKVLYIEDDGVEATRTIGMMRRHGLEVVHTRTAEEALRILNESFELVVADFYLLGDMSGGDFLHTVRCGLRDSREKLPVLVVTGDQSADMQAEIFHAGGNDFVSKPVMEEVLISRIRSLLQMSRQFRQLSQQSNQLRRLATTDSLTGVYNRRHLLQRVDSLVNDPDQHPLWVAVIDLDHFKNINDRHGHGIGDNVLRELGRLLSVEFGSDDLVARFGGEEFVAVIPAHTREQVEARLDQLRQDIERLRPAGFTVTASLGVAGTGEQPRTSFGDLFRNADQAMYEAKNGGRNRMVFAADTPAS
jgi:two-component system cell cycle response regulator